MQISREKVETDSAEERVYLCIPWQAMEHRKYKMAMEGYTNMKISSW